MKETLTCGPWRTKGNLSCWRENYYWWFTRNQTSYEFERPYALDYGFKKICDNNGYITLVRDLRGGYDQYLALYPHLFDRLVNLNDFLTVEEKFNALVDSILHDPRVYKVVHSRVTCTDPMFIDLSEQLKANQGNCYPRTICLVAYEYLKGKNLWEV